MINKGFKAAFGNFVHWEADIQPPAVENEQKHVEFWQNYPPRN